MLLIWQNGIRQSMRLSSYNINSVMCLNENQIIELIEKFGSPLYVFDDGGFIDNYRNLTNSFRRVYENYIPAYSYKTNYTPHICKLVKQLGGYAEVVSDMELKVALKIGYNHDKIIYNGPAKGDLLEKHLLNNGITNVDNIVEAKRIIYIAQNNPDITVKVGIRINSDIGAGFISRFGVDIYSEDLSKTVNLLKFQSNIRIVGLHLHVSRARYLSAFQKRINNILKVADRIIEGEPEYIDIGSGMFADMEQSLKNQFKIEVPTYEDYAKVVAESMANHYQNSADKPILFTEPGTTLVSRYLSILTSVLATKKIQNRNIAILDIDIHNVGETAKMMRVPYTHHKTGTGQQSDYPIDLSGFTCLEQDVIYPDFPSSVKVGDILELRNIGGYSVVYKPPFINPCCPMIAIRQDGEVEEIKRKETFEDVFQTYKF